MIASSDGTDEPFPMGQNNVIHAKDVKALGF
jgi:hypothetical protein